MATTSDWGVTDDLWTRAKKPKPAGAVSGAASLDPTGMGTPWDASPSSTGSAAPVAASGGPATAPAAAPTSPYAPLVSQIAATPDPTQKAVTQDALGRQLYGDLSAEGHDVKWSADGQLLVDGKPYTVAGDTAPAVPPPSPVAVATSAARRRDDDPGGDDGTGGGPGTGPGPGFPNPNPFPAPNPTPGPFTLDSDLDPKKLQQFQTSHDWKGLFQYLMTSVNTPNGVTTLTNPTVVATLKKYGFTVSPANASGITTKIQTPDGHWVRVLAGLQSGDEWTWVDNGPGGGAGSASAPGAGPIDFQAFIDALEKGGLFKTPPYNPTAIDPNAIPWLQHPETFSPQLISELESRNSEGQMTTAQLGDEDLARFGAAHDLGSSPWLAAGRAGNLASARQGIISGTRDIDIAAQTQNAQDRLHAAGMIVDIDKFNETIKQQATALGISAANLKSQVLLALLSMAEGQSQFGANLQLSYDELQRLLNNDAWDRAKTATGA